MGNPPKMDGLYKIKSWKLVKMYVPPIFRNLHVPSELFIEKPKGSQFFGFVPQPSWLWVMPIEPRQVVPLQIRPDWCWPRSGDLGAGFKRKFVYSTYILHVYIYIYYIIYVLYIAYNIYIYTHIMSDFSSLHGLYIYCSVDVPLIHIGCCFKRRLHKRAATIN